jgi:quercetin dioxygenase-like cupin family protein
MPHAVQITQLLKTTKSWNGSPLPGIGSGTTEFKVLHFRIPPGAKTTIHLHPMNGAGYMIEGELTMFSTEDPHGSFDNPKQVKKVKLKTGDAWAESVNAWHYGENTGKEEAEFILIFAGQVDTPPTLSLGTHPE